MVPFADFAKMLEHGASTCRARLAIDLAEIGAHQMVIAAELIGHELPEFAPLAPATIEQKAKLGYTGQVSNTDPLLRTGANRDSLKVVVDPIELEMAHGSDRKEFLYQEIGTGKIPPRPVLAMAALRSLEFAEEKLNRTAFSLLTGTNR